MYLKTFEICVLKCMDLTLFVFLLQRITMTISILKIQSKIKVFIDIDMLLLIGKGIRGGICLDIHRYVKGNNKYMNDYDKNKELPYLNYCDVNNVTNE